MDASWSYRFLEPRDIDEVKDLCRIWFPVRYPEFWYQDVTSAERYYSLAATHPVDGHIIGMIVCDVKSLKQVNREDHSLLSREHCTEDSRVAYILSLGVVESFRRKRLGSALLNKLIEYLTSPVKRHVKAVYLHVLFSNMAATSFYRKHDFREHMFLPFYYHINGRSADACSYVRYINGGTPPKTIIYPLFYNCVPVLVCYIALLLQTIFY
ncbi:N-alpha-acetyltransferase 60-like [Watersipora subatra]|uniref:N-alpha-acetyltransferase 60-like n=1 Tax=Watersipora subatra TaxID=2589382 RepID=UPI00355BF4EC